jgi:Resolvase, N terminal domain
LIIAKLDRLSRDVHFLTGLEKAGVDFLACDLPDANRLSIHIMAAVAQYEVERISERTKDALAPIKSGLKTTKSGKAKLGNPNGATALRRAGKGNVAAVKVIKSKAIERAERLRGELQDIQASGITTLAGIAAKLNERHIRPPNDRLGNKVWHPNSVRRLITRVGTKLTFRVHKDRAEYAIGEALANGRIANPRITKEPQGDLIKITIEGDVARQSPPSNNSIAEKDTSK